MLFEIRQSKTQFHLRFQNDEDHLIFFELILSKKTKNLISLNLSKKLNLDSIRNQCMLKESPFSETGVNLKWRLGESCLLNNKSIKMKYISVSVNDHLCPLTRNYKNTKEDRYLRLPEYDSESLMAFVFCRFAWGMNITFAYLSVEESILYFDDYFNHDHPEGHALKKDGANVQLFTCLDGWSRIEMFPPNHVHYRNDSTKWISLNPHSHFDKIKKAIPIFKKHNRLDSILDFGDLITHQKLNDDNFSDFEFVLYQLGSLYLHWVKIHLDLAKFFTTKSEFDLAIEHLLIYKNTNKYCTKRFIIQQKDLKPLFKIKKFWNLLNFDCQNES